MRHLLLIDDDPVVVPAQLRQTFGTAGIRVSCAATAAAGLEVMRRDGADVVLLDLRLPDGDGLDILEQIKRIDASVPVIFVTMTRAANTAIEAMKLGAFNFLHKPLDLRQLQDVVQDAFAVARSMRSEVVLANASAPDEMASVTDDALLGGCPAIVETYKAIGRVAAQDVTVLITGESGTGKEVVARAIYQHSARSTGPFLALNCAAIPENLLESELFGHEKGAFTGAGRRRIGKFEQCQGGTLLLDEIGDMPPSLQTKLLRVLQERTFERVGGNETLRADVRIIASTHRDLKARAAAEQFRPDLYYRLSVFTIHLPSLRERGDDVALLAHHYVRRFRAELGRGVSRISPEAMSLLRSHSWPGNIRELQSVLKQALLKASGTELLPAFLPPLEDGADVPSPRSTPPSPAPRFSPPPTSRQADLAGVDLLIDRHLAKRTEDLYADAHGQLDRLLFARVLTHTQGNQREAARLLGIARQTMRTKLRALGMRASSLDNGEEDARELTPGVALAMRLG